MSDQAILLKIHREFTENEAVQHLLNELKESQLEVGMLKSELAEAQYKLQQYENGEGKQRRLWLKEDVIKDMHEEIEALRKKQADNNKTIEKLISRCAVLGRNSADKL